MEFDASVVGGNLVGLLVVSDEIVRDDNCCVSSRFVASVATPFRVSRWSRLYTVSPHIKYYKIKYKTVK